jgi:hypothetical protein
MKFSKLTRPELEEIMKNANFTDEEAEVFKLLVSTLLYTPYYSTMLLHHSK